jgi:hypothetical protein
VHDEPEIFLCFTLKVVIGIITIYLANLGICSSWGELGYKAMGQALIDCVTTNPLLYFFIGDIKEGV